MRHAIAKDKAVEMMRRKTIGWAFDREVLDAMLSQPGAEGVRIYMGQNDGGAQTPILVAIDKAGRDLFGVIAEEATPCPPYCDPSSALHA